MKERSNGIELILDWLGGICAFITVIVYGLLIIHANWNFLPVKVFNVMQIIKTWAPLVVVAITGLEFTQGRSLLVKLLFYALMAVVIVFMFFPNTWDSFTGFINK